VNHILVRCGITMESVRHLLHACYISVLVDYAESRRSYDLRYVKSSPILSELPPIIFQKCHRIIFLPNRVDHSKFHVLGLLLSLTIPCPRSTSSTGIQKRSSMFYVVQMCSPSFMTNYSQFFPLSYHQSTAKSYFD